VAWRDNGEITLQANAQDPLGLLNVLDSPERLEIRKMKTLTALI
jgi:hypothetical protein